MKKNFVLICLMALGMLPAKAQKKSFDDKVKDYVSQYSAWAIEEQQRVGIPAAIKLAQGIYETSAGESELAVMANNHFGIKCKKDWMGETFAHTDDLPDECFRKYKSAKESYKDHSNYLKNSPRYARLWTLKKTDYKSWCTGLKSCGYATNPQYAQRLIHLIETYDLQLYTFAGEGQRQNEVIPVSEPPAPADKTMVETDPLISSEKTLTPPQTRDDGSVIYNNLRAVYCLKGENLLSVAMKYNIRYPRLLEINELPDAPLSRDMFIYLEPKHSKGIHTTHVVQRGETIEMIAQSEGMTARQLRAFNLMDQSEQPESATILQLQSQAGVKPEVYRIVNGEVVKTVSMPARLANPAAQDKADYVPTKKAASSEEFEFGMGAVPPPMVNETKPAVQPATTPAPKPVSAAARMTAPTDMPAARVERNPLNTAAPAEVKKEIPKDNSAINPQTGKPYLESEWRAENDHGSLPLSLDENAPAATRQPLNKVKEQSPAPAEPVQDELAALKARLDQSVYSRSSRSNIKVTSSDSAAVYNAPPPPTGTVVNSPVRSTVKPVGADDANATYHVVKTGETAYSIAKQYGIKVQQLNQMNGIDFQGIKVGQKLRVK
ncbi:glucosaminidase domain-containing protein [Rurimicrobium arvi]|uniref:Peptidoglycan hydrolase n=1 Tax=Rurimicrobium arvi TaxID=2049916 RepID=A0ABP8MT30_9BACT